MKSVLAASSSEYRRWWYCHHLASEGFVVRVATDGMECLNLLRRKTPDILILETPLLWGGADGVLDVLESESARGEIRVLLVAVKNDPAELYGISRHVVDDVLTRIEIESRLVDHLHRLTNCDGTRAIPLTV